MLKLNLYKTLIVLSLLITSCSSINKDYYAISSTLNDLKSPFYSIERDTIEIVDYSFKMNESILNGYKTQKEIALNNKLKSSTSYFEWLDEKYKWVLNDDDIDFMLESLKNQEKNLWIEKKFKNSKKTVKIVDYPVSFNRLDEDRERQERIKEDKFAYIFSQPIFNKKKDVCIIQYRILLLPHSSNTLIYKKEKNKWVKIAQLVVSTE